MLFTSVSSRGNLSNGLSFSDVSIPDTITRTIAVGVAYRREISDVDLRIGFDVHPPFKTVFIQMSVLRSGTVTESVPESGISDTPKCAMLPCCFWKTLRLKRRSASGRLKVSALDSVSDWVVSHLTLPIHRSSYPLQRPRNVSIPSKAKTSTPFQLGKPSKNRTTLKRLNCDTS